MWAGVKQSPVPRSERKTSSREKGSGAESSITFWAEPKYGTFITSPGDGSKKRKAAQPRVNRDPATPWGKRREKESFGLSKASCRAENAVQVTPSLACLIFMNGLCDAILIIANLT